MNIKQMITLGILLFSSFGNGMESNQLQPADDIPLYFCSEDFNAENLIEIPEPNIPVGVNDGKSLTIPAQDKNSYIFYTDSLLGCVATIVDIEHHNNDHTIAMCHFAHYAKKDNVQYLKEFFNQLERENKLQTIKKASCIICPPGIYASSWLDFIPNKQVIPTFDKMWKESIINTLKEKIPSISVDIKPYLMNRRNTTVKYFFAQEKPSKIEIVNKSLVAHPYTAQLLKKCQQYTMPMVDIKPLIIPTISALFISWYIYFKTK